MYHLIHATDPTYFETAFSFQKSASQFGKGMLNQLLTPVEGQLGPLFALMGSVGSYGEMGTCHKLAPLSRTLIPGLYCKAVDFLSRGYINYLQNPHTMGFMGLRFRA